MTIYRRKSPHFEKDRRWGVLHQALSRHTSKACSPVPFVRMCPVYTTVIAVQIEIAVPPHRSHSKACFFAACLPCPARDESVLTMSGLYRNAAQARRLCYTASKSYIRCKREVGQSISSPK